MSKNEKNTFFLFSVLEYKTIEEYFITMAAEGWMLESVSGIRAKFKKIEPCNIKFTVDIFPSKNYRNSEKSSELLEYIEMCEQSGWTYITSVNALQIFYSKTDGNILPIQTDSEIEEKIVRKAVVSPQTWLTILPMFWILFLCFNGFLSFSYRNLYSNIILVSYLYLPTISIIFIAYIIFYILWFAKSKSNVRNKKPLPKVPLKVSLIRGSITLILGGSVFLLFVSAVIADLINGQRVVISFIIPVFIIEFIIIVIMKKLLNNKGTIKKAYIIMLCIASFVVVMGVTIFSISYMGSNSIKETKLPDKCEALTISDFYNYKYVPEHYSFNKSSSIIIPESYTYWEVGEKSSVRTEYTKSVSKKIALYIFNEIADEMSEKFSNDIIAMNEVVLGVDAAYCLEEDENKILILNGKEVVVVEFDLDIDVSSEQVAKVLREKFGD